MKKKLPILMLAIFALSLSIVGFLGFQPVKADLFSEQEIEVAGVGYVGASITYGEQNSENEEVIEE